MVSRRFTSLRRLARVARRLQHGHHRRIALRSFFEIVTSVDYDDDNMTISLGFASCKYDTCVLYTARSVPLPGGAAGGDFASRRLTRFNLGTHARTAYTRRVHGCTPRSTRTRPHAGRSDGRRGAASADVAGGDDGRTRALAVS